MRFRIRSATCDHYSDEHCDVCLAEREAAVCTPRFHPFQGGFFEHLSPEGVHCETPADLRAACEKHGAYSAYLENSLHGGRIGKLKEI